MAGTGWRARADEVFLVSMPGRGRILLEMALLLALVFGETVLMLSPILAGLLLAAELGLALALVRPWTSVHGGILGRALATVLVVLAVVAPAMVEHPEFAGPSRRLGIGIANGALEPGDPPGLGGVVQVQTVAPHTPADGVLRPDDRIVALAGTPLDRGDASADLTRRTHGDELPEDTTVTVLRDHAVQDLHVHIPRVHDPRHGVGQRIGALRDLSSRHLVIAAAARGALIIALLLLLLRADGQPLAAVGIVRAGAARELLAASWMALGTFGVQIVVAIPIGIIGILSGVMQHEATQRTQALGAIAGQASIGEFIVPLLVAAAFEELAFRGFLVPRMRVLLGSWVWAVLAVSVLFGLGHFYEGALAVVQTAFLGIYFSAMLLLRRRLLGPTVAHAAFNTVMLLVVRFVLQSGVVEQLKQMAPH
jgi:membrane protease YdiL (CAAX protease family)